MNAYKIRSIVMADGSIVIKGIPFSVGKSVEVIILDDVYSQTAANPLDERWKSLQGFVTRYDDPFDSLVSPTPAIDRSNHPNYY